MTFAVTFLAFNVCLAVNLHRCAVSPHFGGCVRQGNPYAKQYLNINLNQHYPVVLGYNWLFYLSQILPGHQICTVFILFRDCVLHENSHIMMGQIYVPATLFFVSCCSSDASLTFPWIYSNLTQQSSTISYYGPCCLPCVLIGVTILKSANGCYWKAFSSEDIL